MMVKSNKVFKPPLSKAKHLELYISCLRNTVNSNVTNKILKWNISTKQYNAIQNLKKPQSIVIKAPKKDGL